MKRFYKMVSVGDGGQDGSIELDGRPVKTQDGKALKAPSQDLAQAVAAEWMAQTETIQPETMPLTQLLSTALDQVTAGRDEMTRGALSYLDTDLICYRTSYPSDLGALQEEIWNPWIKWFEKRYGEALQVTLDLKALKQPLAAHEKVAAAVAGFDDFAFTVFQALVPLTGSLILSLAFMDGAATDEQLFMAVTIEETYKGAVYNEEKHGRAPSQLRRDEFLRRDLEAARLFLSLLPRS